MELFAQFIQERVYLKGVSRKTVISYQCAFKASAGAAETKTDLRAEDGRLSGRRVCRKGCLLVAVAQSECVQDVRAARPKLTRPSCEGGAV